MFPDVLLSSFSKYTVFSADPHWGFTVVSLNAVCFERAPAASAASIYGNDSPVSTGRLFSLFILHCQHLSIFTVITVRFFIIFHVFHPPNILTVFSGFQNLIVLGFDIGQLTVFFEKQVIFFASNMSVYLRKMAIDGMIINTDTTYLKAMYQEMHKIGVNINQLAKVANTVGTATPQDIEELKEMVKKIWLTLRSFQSNLQ